MLSTIAEIIRDLLIFLGVIAALLITLVVAVSRMPNSNPLKRVLTALCYPRRDISGRSYRYPIRADTGN